MSETPSVQAAVCVVTVDPALDDCLRALAAQAEATLVVTAGLGGTARAAVEEWVRAALPAPVVVHETLPGLAQARNRALAESAADVIAFVDADVAVGDDWWSTLRREWAGAPSDLACLGGPIRVDFPAGRPRRLTDGVLGVFGPLDYGDRAVEIDPLERTLMGGNVSFRTSALRGVGGFWPARGRDDVRDWFSEEHHAQRELARVGWRVAYEPALAGTRVVGHPRVGDVLARRLRYGARSGLVGRPRSRGAAAAQAVKGLLGAGIAVLRGARAQAVERAARAAENAGVLLAARLAHADFQPVARATPFSHSIAPAQSRRRRASSARTERGPVVLLYHRVASPESDPLGLCVAPDNFEAQVEVLRTRCTPLPLGEVANRVRAGEKLSSNAVAVTFDDGYADNVAALELLAAGGVPATLFVSTGHVEAGRWFWWDELDVAMRSARDAAGDPLSVARGTDARSWPPKDAQQRAATRGHLHRWLASLHPHDAAAAVAAVREWAGAADGGPPDEYRPMTLDELRAVAALPGIEIGAHTRHHASLGSVGADAARDEIAGGRADLGRWLGRPPREFSYPFGVPGVDFTDTTARDVASAGFELAVSNQPGRVTQSVDPFALPRHVAPDLGQDAFARWLSEA